MAVAQLPSLNHSTLATNADEILDTELALKYLNAQLQVNYESANERYNACKDHEHLTEERKKTHAWARYDSRWNGAKFQFGQPCVHFVCDHDAVLKVQVHTKEGNFNERPGEPDPGKVTVALRVTTERRTILGKDLKIGDYESRIHLLVFDFDHAKVDNYGENGQQSTEQTELNRQMLGYARYLQAGGHHVLFFPPEFDEDDLRRSVKFSLVAKAKLVPLDSIGGVSSIMINNYLSLLWFTCAFIARTQGEMQEDIGDDRTWLAAFCSWTVDKYNPEWRFSIRLGQPRVDILCAREVILYFTLSEVWFFAQSDQIRDKGSPDYKGWTIALLIDVEVSDTRVELKTSTVRYSERYSKYAPAPREEHTVAQQKLIAFFVDQYIKHLGRTSLRYLFQRRRLERPFSRQVGEVDGSWWMLERSTTFGASALDSTIRHTNMCGFDLAIAISQSSINNQLRLRFRDCETLHSWRTEGADIEVKTISVMLLPNSRAVVTIDVTEATLSSKIFDEMGTKLVKDEGFAEATTLGECRLSFEVQLVRCADREPKHRHCTPKMHHPNEYTDHIYLDLRHASIDAQRTSFEMPGEHLNENEESEARRRSIRLTLLYHIMTSYFDTMEKAGMHIVATVPVYKYSPQNPSFYKFTSMNFVTSAFEEVKITAEAGGETTTRVEQILFVLGMTGEKPCPDPSVFKPSPRWIAQASTGFSHGTFAISNFRDRLFTLLAHANKFTTLVPISPSYNLRTDEKVVQRWDLHPDFKDQECKWELIQAGDGLDAQTYEWKYSREWRVQDEGTSMRKGGLGYQVLCSTSNELHIPDLTQLASGSFEVTMSGQIKLRISSNQHDSAWSTESSASWKVTFSIRTTSRGFIKVEIDGADSIKQPPPKNTIRRDATSNIPDAYAILRGHLPEAEQFTGILTELKELEGAWKYYYPSIDAFMLCSPTFNFVGDLLFELRRTTDTREVVSASRSGIDTTHSSIPKTPIHNHLRSSGVHPTPNTNGQPSFRTSSSQPASPQGDPVKPTTTQDHKPLLLPASVSARKSQASPESPARGPTRDGAFEKSQVPSGDRVHLEPELSPSQPTLSP